MSARKASLKFVLCLAAAVAVVYLYQRYKISGIIGEEIAMDLRDSSPGMKVIVASDGTVARYVTENEEYYVGEIQDRATFRRDGAHTEMWYASDGRGVVFLREPGFAEVYSIPDSVSSPVGVINYAEGCVPETYRCLGYADPWYEIELDGESRYVSAQNVSWDAIDTF